MYDQLTETIDRAADALVADQRPDGHWCFELEADCTIPAEYIVMMHFMDEVDEALQAKLATYLRRRQNDEGGWPLYYAGDVDISCSVKSYYALKLSGDDPNEDHMRRAREAIVMRGGASRANVFTRIMLAMFEQVPWRAAPFMPVEVMLLPKWFFFHLDKVAYWSRTVMVPLLILCSARAKARNPTGRDVQELFVTPPQQEKHWFPTETRLARLFLLLDEVARRFEWMIPKSIRRRAIARAEDWFIERLNGEDGLGAIFPAMVNAYEAMDLLGYPPDHPDRRTAKRALEKLLVENEDEAWCQPCVSPVWDTGLAAQALLATGGRDAEVTRALDWLRERQITDVTGDWAVNAAAVEPGGWAFQYANDYYPDLDDTAMVAWAMDRSGHTERYGETISRARDWIVATRSSNGGYAAFDVDNTRYYLNEIPFADHGALLDPPTADVTGRCAAFLGRLGETDALAPSIDYLRREQDPSGAWFGRWGTNYIYGTWSVLSALIEAGIPPSDESIQRGVRWLLSIQRPDGGWGEDNDSYEHDGPSSSCSTSNQGSTSFQTAWAVLALVACGEAHSDAVRRGVEYLIRTQNANGEWKEPYFTAPGFPRVFYLKYHGYSHYFPLWALAEYRNAIASERQRVA